MVQEKGRKRKFKGKAKDMGIMTRMDEYLAPNQPPRSKEYRQRMVDQQFPRLDGPVAKKKVDLSPEDATNLIKEKAFELGADLLGYTELDPRFAIKGEDVAGKWAVSLAIEMDYDDIATAPEERSGIEVTRAYYILGKILIELAAFIRSLGHKALAHHPRSMYGRIGAIHHKPIAYMAGLGEIGRNTLLITPEFGPRVRVATISTELEVVPDEPMDLGIAKYCDKCKKCMRFCPTGSIPEERTETTYIEAPRAEKVKVWRLDYDKCLPFFIRTDGCAVCIKECTFNRLPDDALGFLEKKIGKSLKSRARPGR
jgi:ferredoxin